MPHVRIDLSEAHRGRIAELSDAVHHSLVAGLDMIPDDLFQIFHVHSSDELVFSATFPGANRSDLIFIQILATVGYSTEAKQRFFTELETHFRDLSIPRDHLMVSIIETSADNWYAPGAEVAG